MRKYLIILSVILGVAGIAAVVHFVGAEDIFEKFQQVGAVAFGVFLLNCLVILLLHAAGWRLLLRSAGHKIAYADVTRGMFMGYAISFLTPSLYLGGEPVRTFFIAREYGIQKRRVLATVILHKFQELCGFLIFIYVGTVVVYFKYGDQMAAGVATSILVADILLGLFFLGGLISFLMNYYLTPRLFTLLARLGPQRARLLRLAQRARDMEDLIHESLRRRTAATLLSALLTGGTMIFIFIKPSIFFYFLWHENPFDFSELALIFVMIQLLQSLQFTPGGVGIVEGGLIFILGLVGASDAEAIAFAAFQRLTDVLFVSAGVWLGLHYGLTRFAVPKKKPKPLVVEASHPSLKEWAKLDREWSEQTRQQRRAQAAQTPQAPAEPEEETQGPGDAETRGRGDTER